MNLGKKPFASVTFWLICACVFLACRVLSQEESPKDSVQLRSITTTSVSKPLRKPNFAVFMREDKPSIFILWSVGTQDRAKPGQIIYQPRQTYWTLLGAAQWNGGKFQVLNGALEFRFGQNAVGNAGADFSIINPATAPLATTKKLAHPLLIHPFFNGGGISSNSRVAIHALPSKPEIDEQLYSELPTNTREPAYLAAVKKYKLSLEKIAKERGVKVVDATNFSTSKPGDILFMQDDVRSPFDYFRFKGMQSANSILWLAGLDQNPANTDRPQKYLWVTKSVDNGKSWDARQLVGRGDFPIIANTKNNDLLLLYTHTDQFGWQGQWPDDVGRPATKNGYHWPGRGSLMMMRSKDGGKTWSKPQIVVADKQVIQSRACLAPDGRIFVV